MAKINLFTTVGKRIQKKPRINDVNFVFDDNNQLNAVEQTSTTIIGSSSQSSSPQWTKITKTYSDLSSTASTNDISIYTLAAKEYIHDVKVLATTDFSGGSLGNYVLGVGIASNLTKYAQVGVFSNSGSIPLIHTPAAGVESLTTTTDIRLRANGSGQALNQAVQGSANIYILTSILP